VQRYEWERPGDLNYVVFKTLARLCKVGHRITVDRQKGRSYGDAYNKDHVAVDDATRLAYIEVLADERKPTMIGLLGRSIAFFHSDGIECRRMMSDHRPSYVYKAFAKTCHTLGLRHTCTRPYTPLTNGKAERFIQTLYPEWAYAMAYPYSKERKRWLPSYLAICNWLRTHSALGWRSSHQQFAELLR